MFRSNHTRGQTNSQKGFLDHLDLGRGFSDFAKGAQTPPKFQPGRIPLTGPCPLKKRQAKLRGSQKKPVASRLRKARRNTQLQLYALDNPDQTGHGLIKTDQLYHLI